MEKIGDLFFKEKRVGHYVKEWQGVSKLNKNKEQFLGKLSRQLSVRYFKNGTLFLSTSRHVWVQEIHRYKTMLISRGNSILGKALIKNIRVTYEKNAEPPPPIATTHSPDKTLIDHIKSLNDERQKQGLRLCRSCGSVYTKALDCVFCVSAQRYSSLTQSK